MTMEMCRVCLSTENQLFPLYETFVINYNLLTNLNITLLDGMPQYACETCLDTVQCFVTFREKSITAENTLRQIIYSDVKAEDKTLVKEIDNSSTVYENDIKSEIKEEDYDALVDNYDNPYSDCDEDKNNIILKKDKGDVKPKRIKGKKPKKLKIKTSELIQNLANKLENQWLCGICPKTFENKSEVNIHLDSHNKDRKCELCRQQTNSLSQLLAHRLIHVPKKQSKCHICDKKYRACLYLEHHYRNFHIEGDSKYLSCTECSVTVDKPKKLNNHMRQVHSRIKFICDICSKGFRNKTNLKSHIRSHGVTKSYVCDMCGFSCKYNSGLKDHKIRKHVPQRVYCKKCKRPFHSKEHHDQHKCKDQKVICPICGLELIGPNKISRHMIIHSDVRKYECTRCPAKYKSRTALIAHLNKHDGNRTKHCEYCPAKFYSATVLIKHRRIHTGEKPYVCKICNKGFTGNHNLKVHMRVHGEYLIVKKNTEQEDLTNVVNYTK